MTKMTLPKRCFLQRFPAEFSENFGERRQIDLEKGPESLASISADISHYRKIQEAEGAKSAPPSGAWVNLLPLTKKRHLNDCHIMDLDVLQVIR